MRNNCKCGEKYKIIAADAAYEKMKKATTNIVLMAHKLRT